MGFRQRIAEIAKRFSSYLESLDEPETYTGPFEYPHPDDLIVINFRGDMVSSSEYMEQNRNVPPMLRSTKGLRIYR